MPNLPNSKKPKKTAQVGFKVTDQLFEELNAAATDTEDRGPNELARLIFEWAFEEYKKVGSLAALTGRKPFTGLPAPNVGSEVDRLSQHEKDLRPEHGPSRTPAGKDRRIS